MKHLRPHFKSMLLVGLPLVGGNLAQFSISIVDTAMLGRYNAEALAASILAGSFYFIVFIVGGGFSFAVMPMVAAHDVRGEDAQVRRVTRMALWLSFIYAAASFPLLFFSKPIFLALGQSEILSTLSQDYLQIAAFGMFPALLGITFRNYLSGLKHTSIVLWATLAGLVLNILMNWILIFGRFGAPEMGIRGAATASVGVQLLVMLVMIAYINRHLARHELFKNLWRPDWAALITVSKLGLPIGLTYLAETGLFSATAVMMGWIGTIELAAHGIALQLAAITFMVHLGLSQGATTLVGNAYGLNDRSAQRRLGVVSIAMTTAFAAVAILVFLTIPGPLLALFLDTSQATSPAILASGIGLITVAAAFQLADGLQAAGLGLLRGIQDVRIPFIYAAISYWLIGMPTSYFLGFTLGYGGKGVWAGLVTGLTAAAILLLARYWRKTRA
ncbi:MATE efflux family protein [Rhodobacterales bacterium HTCC2150]|nr:MATE efflux family protein [Rhodobacterales bacterium HTCC2150] [Rhodobacteraceae bacterium HTCC2150]